VIFDEYQKYFIIHLNVHSTISSWQKIYNFRLNQEFYENYTRLYCLPDLAIIRIR